MKNVHSNHGFTLMELMVTTIIVSILGGIAVPKYFDVIEATRQKVDLTKLYHLRSALNIALIEDLGALSNYSPNKKDGKQDIKQDLNTFEQGLKSDQGATLFVMELHNGLSVNVQGEHSKMKGQYNICRMIGQGGTWYTALNESGFEGVAEIVANRLDGNKISKGGQTYNSSKYTASYGTDYRTAPKKPLFTSRALNIGKKAENTRYAMKVRWTEGWFGGTSVEIYIAPDNGTYESAYRTDQGVCFSTYGRVGCARSPKTR